MTNKIVLRTVEQFMEGYKPRYIPLMPLFMARGKQYAVEVGKIDFKRTEAIGDLRNRRMNPKDTEIHQLHSREGTKTFKKYFFGSQYVQSKFQDTKGYEDAIAQFLDEHNKQNDEIFLTGDGQNNGLYTSSDANYNLKSSVQVSLDADNSHLADLYQKMVTEIQIADEVDGRKLVLVYGDVTIGKYNSLFKMTDTPFSKVIGEALPEVSFAKMPKAVTPASAEGYMIINLDQIDLHYTQLPGILGQGVNEEKMYAWTNFLLGSCMVEVLAKDGIVRQPVTYETAE